MASSFVSTVQAFIVPLVSTMDKWFDDQLKKMELGGNQKAKDFFSSQPDYSPNMSMKDKYHSHFAELYRSKLSAEAEGRPWTPTLASKKPSTPTTSSTRSLNLSNEHRSSSSISLTDTKARNEEYFAKLGNVNDSRPDNLPPSQGGKYTGFGNPQFDYSSQSSNTDIHDLINDPRAAIEKGWSLLSSVGKAAVELGRHVKNNAVNGEYVNPAVIDQIRDNVNYYVNSLTQPRQTQSSASSFLYSSNNHTSSGADDMTDEDFFKTSLGSSNNNSYLSPTTTTIPSAKPSRPTATTTDSSTSVRARANSSNRRKTNKANDEWSDW
ncbi:hypothetical protein RMCBS344292_14978 [Rhizopus microsporus]|nr:hypothetical protein RMCBS344292_14978 [Rhizopus microsporus]